MSAEKSRLRQLDELMDLWLTRRDQEIATGTYYDDEDEDTDPMEFLESSRTLPVAEPPATPQEDSATQRIHGAGRKDLFS